MNRIAVSSSDDMGGSSSAVESNSVLWLGICLGETAGPAGPSELPAETDCLWEVQKSSKSSPMKSVADCFLPSSRLILRILGVVSKRRIVFRR